MSTTTAPVDNQNSFLGSLATVFTNVAGKTANALGKFFNNNAFLCIAIVDIACGNPLLQAALTSVPIAVGSAGADVTGYAASSIWNSISPF